MKNRYARILAFAALSAGVFPIASAQQPAPPAAAIDPGAIEALKKMGTYLRTLKAYQVQASTTGEEVLDNGLKAQYAAETDLLVATPNRLRAQVRGDRKERLYFYDGKNFTIYSTLTKYYATAPAPPTLAQAGKALADKYGIELPLADLITWGHDPADVAGIRAAVDLGSSVIEGTTCAHYAFRQEGLDWQIWMQLGDYPLPRKLVLTTTTDEARPQFTSVMTWSLAPSFSDSAFTFQPPKDAMKIPIREAQARTASSSR